MIAAIALGDVKPIAAVDEIPVQRDQRQCVVEDQIISGTSEQ